MLPLVLGMPLRFTETESREAGAFKHTRCVLKSSSAGCNRTFYFERQCPMTPLSHTGNRYRISFNFHCIFSAPGVWCKKRGIGGLANPSTACHPDKPTGGIETTAEEQERINACEEPEIVLARQPQQLCLELDGKHGETKIYHMKPRYVTWTRDANNQATVRRRGFILVPDFAGTAHAYCGSTLEKCKGATFLASPPAKIN